MTSVSVNQGYKTVAVTEGDGQTSVVSAPSPAITVETVGVGPQGPTGPQGIQGIQGPQGPPGQLNLDDSAKVNGSVLYYDAASAQIKADTVWTTSSLTDGGNF